MRSLILSVIAMAALVVPVSSATASTTVETSRTVGAAAADQWRYEGHYAVKAHCDTVGNEHVVHFGALGWKCAYEGAAGYALYVRYPG